MENDQQTFLETVIGILVAAAAATQTWILLNDATDGQAKRQVADWWRRSWRPAVVRAVAWIDSRAITDAMYHHEIAPFLEREAPSL